ncbi:extracellular solute-binding protein [Roseovarius sp. MBR-6]|jgi:spermidine/putrescine transport system substrate-binding protein|uniref:ABC transporter substrate-binding protein n=1 Tax=Roseovarius sp. MBR-6 TaxID=3156459 RepID=UPI0033998256
MKKLIASGLTALLATTGLASAQGVVNLYNWGNYTNPELLTKFEAETGIKVNVTDYDSNDTALARIRQGGHGFDIVVPSNSYMQTWISEGLIVPLDKSIVTNHGNIAPEWVNVDFDPGREYSVPWQWGTTGLIVNTSVYDGDINDASIIFNPPDALKGQINVIPEMSDVMAIAIYYAGGESCTTDMEVMRKVRDTLVEAKAHWKALDYGTVDAHVAGDFSAGIYWNGATMRARLQNADLAYGYPKTGYPIWMDSAAVLADAQNPENAMKFINFILEPENAAMISNFARYANGVTGSEAFMDEVMREAPEIVVAPELAAAGKFSPACSQEVNDLQSQIWTEVLQ